MSFVQLSDEERCVFQFILSNSDLYYFVIYRQYLHLLTCQSVSEEVLVMVEVIVEVVVEVVVEVEVMVNAQVIISARYQSTSQDQLLAMTIGTGKGNLFEKRCHSQGHLDPQKLHATVQHQPISLDFS